MTKSAERLTRIARLAARDHTFAIEWMNAHIAYEVIWPWYSEQCLRHARHHLARHERLMRQWWREFAQGKMCA